MANVLLGPDDLVHHALGNTGTRTLCCESEFPGLTDVPLVLTCGCWVDDEACDGRARRGARGKRVSCLMCLALRGSRR